MNISKNTHKPIYICDKCNKRIDYTYRQGRNIYKYYIYNLKNYTPKKDFDLCRSCEKEFRKWLKEKPIKRPKDLINDFPIWENHEEEI